MSGQSTQKPYESMRSGPLTGRIRVPGDKSISHRSLMFGALATGATRISGLLEAGDVLGTAEILKALGASIARQADGSWLVHGRGVGGLTQPQSDLDFGNSGTGTRLMLGVLAGHGFLARLTGDASLSRRPMGRVLKPLKQMGLEIVEGDKLTLPITVRGRSRPIPITYTLDVPSAQVKSAVLLCGLHAPGETTVIEHEATRDHTERMLKHFGADIRVTETKGGRAITVQGDAELKGRDVVVPADPSSAAFLIAAGAMVPGSDVTVEGVLINPTRTGFYIILKEMGADITFLNKRVEGGEPIADIRVKGSNLHGVRVPPERAPSMIDEYPVLAVLAATATGRTRMEGLAELRAKESDRLAATAAGLTANGVVARVEGDTLEVEGRTGIPGGGRVETHMDHRIAMAFLVLGLVVQRPVIVDDISIVDTSFPQFGTLMTSLGANLRAAA